MDKKVVDDLNLLAERCTTVQYRLDYRTHRMQSAMSKDIQKFAYIINRNGLNYIHRDLFIYDMRKYMLFLMSYEPDEIFRVRFTKCFWVRPDFLLEVRRKSTLKKRDRDIYELVKLYSDYNYFTDVVGSTIYSPLDNKEETW